MPVASAARELTPLPDDAGLRTVLRNVPLLPAPANVDDLVARLDAEEVPVSSGPLAELISDARYIEPASNATHSDEANDRFFAPVSRAVNTNRRPPLAPRLLSGLFNAALLAGALLILWNALLAPDGAPPPVTPMKTAESATASDLTKAPALTVAADEPTPETRTDNAMSPETPASPVKPLEPYRPLASMDAVALPEPELEPVPTTPDPVVEAEAHQARGMLLAVDPAPQSEPAPIAPVPAPDVDLAQPHGTIVSPEPISETVAQPSATYMSLEPAEPMPAAPEPASEAEPSPPSEAVLFAPAAEPPALPTPEPIRAAEAQTVAATALPHPIDVPEPETVPAAAVARPVSQAFPTVRPESPESRSARAKTIVAEPAPPIRPRARERVPFAGIWAASPEACTPAMQEEGHLLARIGARGGRAGDTSCRFKTIRREGNTWHINAACSDGKTSWRSDVRLSLTRGRLTWTSQKGSKTYARCPRA